MRSRHVILNVCPRRKISRKAECNFLTSGEIARILDVKIDVPQRWAERNYVPTVHNGKQRYNRYFRRSDLVEMAKKSPDLLGGIDRDRLFMLLEDVDLADSIAARFPRRKGPGTMIQAVESGRIFPSFKAAARELHVSSQGIHSAMRINGTCAGYHWRRVDPTQLPQSCQTVGPGSLTRLQGSGQHLAQQNGLGRTGQS